MSTTRERFNLSALSLAVMASISMQAHAAENNNNSEEEVEVIEVSGMRGSIAKSINDKRFSKNIADTINAEDVGKNTDQNIADALGRVTGVSIVSRDGEGSQVTIRGATAQQNNITLNGQTLTSTDFSQAVDLSSFSADILSRLEVVKTSSADHDEGSLGGSVNLVTVKPLNTKDDIRTLQIQGRYNDLAEENDHKIQFTFTDKFLDDTLGLVVSAYNQTNSVRRDQYRVGNFVESLDFVAATDQNGNVLNNVRGITQNETFYELHRNESDRTGLTLGVQWLAGDATEVNFDLTYSEQDYVKTFDAVKTRFGSSAGFVEGDLNTPNYSAESQRDEYESPFTDPFADWISVDTDTKTITKNIGRFGQGDVIRSDGGDEQSNLSAILDVKHSITDDLEMSVKLGHSKSESNSLPNNAYTNMQNFNQINSPLLYRAGADIVATGYDCTSGLCRLVAGDTVSDLGENITNAPYTDSEGVSRPGWYDNTNVLTGFNPSDTKTFHLGFIQTKGRTVEDTANNFQVDFDWYKELGPITSFEFGLKLAEREKFVDNQEYRFNSATQTAVFQDPITGERFIIQEGGLNDIRADLIAKPGGLGVDNFMENLGYGDDPVANGLTPIDIKTARDLVLSAQDTVINVDDTETRLTNIDSQALYFKTNFELLDGRLTGDLGVRYVRTDVESKGSAGAVWYTHRDTNLVREFDMIKLKELRDRSLPACPDANYTDDTPGYVKKFGRVDGYGWDTSAGTDPATWTRIPDAGPCYDKEYADWFDIKSVDPSATVYPQDWPELSKRAEDLPVVDWNSMWRHADISGTHFFEFGNLSDTAAQITFDNTSTPGKFDTTGFTANQVQDKTVSAYPASNSHTYTNLLPSLNLNYAFSDELVGRFAVSKTMTRPEIDSLRPGFQLNQSPYWSGTDSNVGSKIDMFNTKLDPLVSKNLDISLEWYFNPTGMLSVAVYHKNMTNFETINSGLYHIRDFREDEGQLDPNSIRLAEATLEDQNDADLEGCFGLKAVADYPFGTGPDNAIGLSDDLDVLCDTFEVNERVNGDGAKITGVELGYSQTYDFLPGIFSGLGLSANYTYQSSKYDTTSADEVEYPVEDTPEHSYNMTGFWEKDGHSVRLSYRGTSDSLVGMDWNTALRGRNWKSGTLWNEGRDSLDLSINYKVNDTVSVSFQAVNLTDDNFRQYFTSRTLPVLRVAADNAAGYEYQMYNEGNPLDGDATKSRTYVNYKVGKTYRLGVRVNF
ncbi:TonB-dependent receptor domain-containing protein [Catenovulum maritimum]|uniref:TonB-dependent receptor n=1 Tax=Catenovulum maritimum TaxID=1513271 RepID=A0A0J8GU95_9ALTE|nr:TonB-dependent receptor [Catenovulum maritimum]KMT64258.1 TonB-dependent receptor [Catenovulum maritimum]